MIKAEGLTNVNAPDTDTYGDASGVSGNASSVWGDLTGLTGSFTGLLSTFTFEADSHGDVAVLAALDESDTLNEWTIGGDLRKTVTSYLAIVLLNPEEPEYDTDEYIRLVSLYELEDMETLLREEDKLDVVWPA
ncbi:hypothetical protein HOI83_00335 [Candidatus Uhrbacteria bacterium]|nr:hypothetical protein [Candidatus Uhrbacteria bacterium]